MSTPQTDLQPGVVDQEAAHQQPSPPDPVHPLCWWCALESVLSIVVWLVVAVAITRLIDWYGWSSWWLVGVAAACLVAAYLLVDLGDGVVTGWRDRRVRRAGAEPPTGGDR